MSFGVLFVSPHAEDAGVLSKMLGPLSLEFDHVRDLQQARNRVSQVRYTVILTEAYLPDGVWQDVLELARDASPGAEVIVTDPLADMSFWAETLRLGAYDLLVQPFCESEVLRIFSNICPPAVSEEHDCPVL